MKEYKTLEEKKEFFCQKTVDDMPELLALIQKYNNDNYIFRGVNEAKFKIYTSAQRKITNSDQKSFFYKINDMLSAVRQSTEITSYFQKLNVPINDILLLGLLQHFGYPSPLIDFTHDINTAIFFAIDNLSYTCNKCDINDYFSLYIIDKRIPDFCSLQSVMENGAMSLNNMLIDYDLPLHQINVDDALKDFKELTYSQFNTITRILILGSKEGKIDIKIPFLKFKCSYNITNPNLENQTGLFMLNNTKDTPLEDLLKKELKCYPPQIICIDIHKSLKEEVQNTFLLKNGINRNSIYPDNKDTNYLKECLKNIQLL